ncbi:type VI secretion system amidase immunity protein Tai4 [Herbaspirillum sp. RTI4]|uniref:type VI secretion system amidase immunity protein Tai4 n=1 Tax=Herbaspirillum sp. RTI4 TaxID=3048640 RepID=UPI002AB38F80|nr:type VI secretion system amidase immunity protein Tai4 [Herbaspirillum sp. RTI4]MDY7577154.1 type VI secretion system amidase immunity protein Tai4 [Herbaspirillum sp. RTI4]MEA9980444.1 type VI secretion system amidase immunity protein Tai4 [Herbaspirillum sp. RTI4]
MKISRTLTALVLCSTLTAVAADTMTAARRTNAVNYKDRALASCLSAAYKGSSAGEDAEISKSGFLEWTYYDEDKGNPATDQLVESYLRRDYRNPVEGYAHAQFNLLKCLDMYHSQELAEQVRKYVPHPDWVGDTPVKKKQIP